MYNDLKYVDVVKHCAQLSMVRVADEIKALPTYSQNGEVSVYVNIYSVYNFVVSG